MEDFTVFEIIGRLFIFVVGTVMTTGIVVFFLFGGSDLKIGRQRNIYAEAKKHMTDEQIQQQCRETMEKYRSRPWYKKL